MAEKQQNDVQSAMPEDVSPQGEAQTPGTEPESAETGNERYQELQNQYLRLAADFENYRKRQAQEREHLLKYGAQNTLETLLPVLDNLERAQQSLSESSDPRMLYKSFEMMSQQLLESLKAIGLTRMNPKGEIFDPELHEAISQVENPELPDHTIAEVYQDGYMLHDRVLRPAKVVVSVNPTTQSEPAADTTQQQPFEPVASEKPGNPFQMSNPPQHGNFTE